MWVDLPHRCVKNGRRLFMISHQERRIRHMHKTLMGYINGEYANDA